jgi:hypothetical protein
MLTTREALDVAINGSRQFHQKIASADGPIVLDEVLNSHLAVADQLIKAAQWLQQQEADNPHVPLLQETAHQVRRGMPAKSAMFMAAGGSESIAQKLYPIADNIGTELLRERILATFAQKKAAFLEQKRMKTPKSA